MATRTGAVRSGRFRPAAETGSGGRATSRPLTTGL